MSSSNTINFSLRPNKGIERAIALDALEAGRQFLGQNSIYVGLGSLWFRDFVMAHRQLGIDKMVSIEASKKIYERAEFNKPLACVEIVEGYTTHVLPGLLERDDFQGRPVVVWLDYDSGLDDDKLTELTQLIERLPAGSAVLSTFSARADAYADSVEDRADALGDYFGELIDEDISIDELKGVGLMKTLSSATLDYLTAAAIDAGREGPFVPAISLMYRDSGPMVTVGGFLPQGGDAVACRDLVKGPNWFGFESTVIETQPLTLRELHALSQLVPVRHLEQADVAKLGFRLDQSQLDFYCRHYSRYPSYVEIV